MNNLRNVYSDPQDGCYLTCAALRGGIPGAYTGFSRQNVESLVLRFLEGIPVGTGDPDR